MHVQAVALWSPQDADAVPVAELLPVRVRARASLLTRMFAEVLTQVAGDAELATLPLIMGSAFGELATTAQLLRMMCTAEGALSPARFQSSVHNAAAGQISIALSSHAFSTCVAAGEATSAAVLLEASAWLAIHSGQVAVAVADEALPDFFAARETPVYPLAAAMLLSAERDLRTMASIGSIERDEAYVCQPGIEAGEACAHSPIAPLAHVVRVVLARQSRRVALPGVSGAWQVDVRVIEALA